MINDNRTDLSPTSWQLVTYHRILQIVTAATIAAYWLKKDTNQLVTIQWSHVATGWTQKSSDLYNRVPLFHWKKIQDFSRIIQDPVKNFPGPFRSPGMLKH